MITLTKKTRNRIIFVAALVSLLDLALFFLAFNGFVSAAFLILAALFMPVFSFLGFLEGNSFFNYFMIFLFSLIYYAILIRLGFELVYGFLNAKNGIAKLSKLVMTLFLLAFHVMMILGTFLLFSCDLCFV